ncbi:MAG TPA: homocysteine S-methyltransferase family protein [Ramlibacter sp.]|nr:homocysteine S-methyltransferase family protein [Ramlibacter sp.]
MPCRSHRLDGWSQFHPSPSQGEPLAACVDALEGCAQVAAVGVDCTAPQHIASLVEIAASRTAKPNVVYPNSGAHYDAAAMCWHGGAAATTLAEHSREWHRLGARLNFTPQSVHPCGFAGFCRADYLPKSQKPTAS